MSVIMEEMISEKAEKIAMNMLRDGKLSLEDIAKYSELPIEKVRQLAGEKTA